MDTKDLKTPYCPLNRAMLLWADKYDESELKRNMVAVEHCGIFAEKFRSFDMSAGACFSNWKEKTPVEQMLYVFVATLQAIVRENVDPKAAVRAISRIWELRYIFSNDTMYAAGIDSFPDEDDEIAWDNNFKKMIKSRKPNPGIYSKES